MRIGFADGILHFSSLSYALSSKCFGLVLNSYLASVYCLDFTLSNNHSIVTILLYFSPVFNTFLHNFYIGFTEFLL